MYNTSCVFDTYLYDQKNIALYTAYTVGLQGF